METRKTTSIKEVEIPNTPWLTLKQGAAYAGVGYARFVEAVNRRELRVYTVPGTETRKYPSRKVKKDEIDHWYEHGPRRG